MFVAKCNIACNIKISENSTDLCHQQWSIHLAQKLKFVIAADESGSRGARSVDNGVISIIHAVFLELGAHRVTRVWSSAVSIRGGGVQPVRRTTVAG